MAERCSRRRRSSRIATLVVALCVLLAACGGAARGEERDFPAPPVDPPFQVADTELSSTQGGTFSLADPGRRLSLVFFGYTSCPDVCPLVMSTMYSALTRLDDEQREQVQVVFVTTDPARDDEKRITTYLAQYEAEGQEGTSVGLTGDLDDIAALGKTVGIFVADGEQLASGGYDLGSHGSQVIAVDAAGEAPAFWRQDVSAADLAADIETLLREDD